jgi:ribosomal-protein-alanine N-acetyltransferase
MPTMLETNRLLLRTWSLEDAEAVLGIYSNPEVTRFIGSGVPDQSLDDARKRILRSLTHQERYGFGFWAVVEKATGQISGSCGLKYLEDGPQIEVGYHLARPVWNRGFATEAAGACLRYGFEKLKLDRIVGVVALENYASQRVLEKVGMRYERLGRHYNTEVRVYAAERTTAIA